MVEHALAEKVLESAALGAGNLGMGIAVLMDDPHSKKCGQAFSCQHCQQMPFIIG